MKKILFACLLVMFFASALAQTHTFESIAFTAGGTISQCAFAPTSLTFNNTNYLLFPGFGTTHTTAAYGDHTHSPSSVGLGNVTNNAQVTSVTAAAPVVSSGGTTPVISMAKSNWITDGYLSKDDYNTFTEKVSSVSANSPLQCTGGPTPELQILRSSGIQSGYLHKDDFARFDNLVSSQWELNVSGIGYGSGYVGIGTKVPAYACDVNGTFNAYDYKSSGSYITISKAYSGTGMMSGIWQDAIATTPNGSHMINHSVTVAPDQGSYFSCYDYTNAYNYKVGIFDGAGGMSKTFAGIVGGAGGKVDQGSTTYPWGNYFGQNVNASGTLIVTGNTTLNGAVGIGTSTPSQALQVVASASAAILVTNSGGVGGAAFQMNDIAGTSNWFFKSTSAGFKIRDNTNLIDVLTIEKASAANTIYIKAGGNVGILTTSPTALVDVNSDVIRLRTSKTPATSNAAGNEGDFCADANYIYFFKSGSWKRAALATW